VFNAAAFGILNKMGGWGLAIGIGYTVLDKSGFITGPLPVMPASNSPYIAVPDATRISNQYLINH